MWHSRSNGSSEPDRESSPSSHGRSSDGDGDGSLRQRRDAGNRPPGGGRCGPYRWWDPAWRGRWDTRGEAEDAIALEVALQASRASEPTAPGGLDLTEGEVAALRENRWPVATEQRTRQALAAPEALQRGSLSAAAASGGADLSGAFRHARLPVQTSAARRRRGEENWTRLVRTHSRARFVRRLAAVLLAHVGTWSRLHWGPAPRARAERAAATAAEVVYAAPSAADGSGRRCRRRLARCVGRAAADGLERLSETLAAKLLLWVIRLLYLALRYGGWLAGGIAAWKGSQQGAGVLEGRGVGLRLLLNHTDGV